MTAAQEAFFAKILPGALKSKTQYSILPSLTMAQAALESDFGKASIGNNVFGIKATVSWKGKKQLAWTTEYCKGVKKRIRAYFRDYASIDDSILDHSKILSLSRYKSVRAAMDYKIACIQVQKCGYATDPSYATKLIKIIEAYNLNQYDEVVETAKYYIEGVTHVVEVDPMNLKISVQNRNASKIELDNMATPGYITWEAIYESGKKTAETKAVPISILASEGKIICNRQPHIGYERYTYPAGTLIVYKDGTVAVKSITDLNSEKDIWFAVGGCSILPKIRMKEEGFCIRKCIDGKIRDFSDIGRTVSRTVIGYNPKKNKIVIATRENSNIGRGIQTLINLGCTMGITLDGGGSTVLRVNESYKFKTTRQLYSVITW